MAPGTNQQFLTMAKDIAFQAGKILREHLGKVQEINFKGAPLNLVTDVDRQSEELIINLLQHQYPQHQILAEEGGTGGNDHEFKWIIDPLDGTTNYAHGYPVFSVSIALERAGEIVCGVVYDPMRQEMFSAAVGQGAFLNEQRIQVSSITQLIKALLVTGFPYDVQKTQNNLAHWQNFTNLAQGIRRDGSAALDCCYVACGRFDGFWEANLAPWDMAAGSLIVTEAGGSVSNWQGSQVDIYANEIVASNGQIQQLMLDTLKLAPGAFV